MSNVGIYTVNNNGEIVEVLKPGIDERVTHGIMGNGEFVGSSSAQTFAGVAGFWTQVSPNPSAAGYLNGSTDSISVDNDDNGDDFTLIKNRVSYKAGDDTADPAVAHCVRGPQIKTQTEVEYTMTDPSQSFNFTRVIGAYHEGIGKGNYSCSADNKTGNFTVLAATAHNKFAGQFGMGAITGRVWDARESEVPGINVTLGDPDNDGIYTVTAGYGASKSCGGYFPFIRRSKHRNGGYMIGIETYCMNNANETEDIPYTNNDTFTFRREPDKPGTGGAWTCGYHCTGTASGAPIAAGIMMDGNTNAKHAFWNGIVIGGSAMRINNNGAGAKGTIGLSLASWSNSSCGDIGIKFGAAGRWHQYFKNGFAFHAGNTTQESHASNATFAIRCGADSVGPSNTVTRYNSALYLQRGATENRTGTPTTIGAFRIGSSQHTEGEGADAVVTLIDYTEIESIGYQRFVVNPVTPESEAKTYVLTSYTFAPFFGESSSSTTSLGTADHKWNHVYAVDGTIQTSDERVKQNIDDIPDAVLDAWGKVNWQQFRMRDAVAEKGAMARTHTGIIAQRIKEIFEDAGLDATQYGLLCHDTWEDQYDEVRVKDADEVIDDNGETVTPEQWHTVRTLVKAAGDMYSIRYEEALAMEAAYQRRRADRLEARVSALEQRFSEIETILATNTN